MKPRLTVVELAKENMKFSAGHFTIFSATERERLHGHNFTVAVSLTTEVDDNGMCFDYGVYKNIIEHLCREWNEFFILPTRSPHLSIDVDGDHLFATFNGKRIPFLREDVLLLPIVNATLEEFSRLILERLTADADALNERKISAIKVTVASGPGQSCCSVWEIESRILA
jgi:6-pyruvoyltetrahydropterin/6-carboxytetrahydropterin synthase